MKPASDFALVLVTAPDLKTGRLLVKRALEGRAVACGNIVPKLESHYWWQGKMEKSAEVLLLFKTKRSALRQLEALILQHHPYDTPEIIALPLQEGTEKYLAWISDSVSLRATA
jgi:periplasmic divalent cation tolerance protein